MTEHNEQVLTATEASRSFSEMLHRVCYSGESFVIKKGNRIMVRITPVDQPVDVKASDVYSGVTEAQLDAALPKQLTPNDVEYYRAMLEEMKKPLLESCE